MKTFLAILFSFCFALFGYGQKELNETVFFDVGSSELSTDAKAKIDDLFPLPEDQIIDKITVVGHADKLGDEIKNLQLSGKRARNVYSYMRENYLDMIIYDVDFVGEENPVFDSRDELNRCVRIKIELLPKLDPPPQNLVEELFPEEFESDQAVAESQPENEKHRISGNGGMSHQKEGSYIPRELKKSDKFQLEDIHFYGNRADYTRDSEDALEQLLDFMRAYPEVRILLEGHVNGKRVRRSDLKRAAERSGGEFYKNAHELSLGRAQAVKNYLMKNGIAADRIETIGKGGDEPIYRKPKNNAQSEANRRIEIVIL
ncbi:OmpA family protein [Halocola ammonii]